MFARRACDTRVAKGGAVAAGWRWAQGMLLCVAHYSVEKLVLFVRTTNLTNQPCSKDDEGLLADPPGEKARSLQALEAIEACIERDAMSMMTHQQASRLVQRALGPCDVIGSLALGARFGERALAILSRSSRYRGHCVHRVYRPA